MKKLCFFIILITGISIICALTKQVTNLKKMADVSILEAGNFHLNTTNYGSIGKFSSDTQGLTYPKNSNVDYLYKGALWIGGSKNRRNENNERLYWKQGHFPPTYQNHDTIPESDPLWNSSLIPVVDTLVSVGFDGDSDIKELLPAYNPIEFPETGFYYENDRVLTGIMGNPHPREFSIPDPQNNYCFTEPVNTTIASEGYETKYAFFYDYSPFNYTGQRDYGSSSDNNNHIPLGIAVSQEIFTWPVQGYDNMFFIKNVIKNTSPVDTIYNFAVSYYFDADIGEMANDDKSGCVNFTNDSFAYALDGDLDNGMAPNYVALKMFSDQDNVNRCVTKWRVGYGPEDSRPLQYWNLTGRTANEKYWLMTERNPNTMKYFFLNYPVNEGENYHVYEEPEVSDTRFLYSYYGQNSNEEEGMYLAPGESKTFYTAVFFATSFVDLLNCNTLVNEFYASSFNPDFFNNKPCRPYLRKVEACDQDAVDVSWHCYSQPDFLKICWKDTTTPESDWMSDTIPVNSTSYYFDDLIYNHVYQIKLVSEYNNGEEENIMMYSSIKEVQVGNISVDDNCVLENNLFSLKNYPNPFNPSTTISFNLTSPENVVIKIYNIKGQLIKNICNKTYDKGIHSINWDGKDHQGDNCGTGVYFYKMTAGKTTQTKKMMMIK